MTLKQASLLVIVVSGLIIGASYSILKLSLPVLLGFALCVGIAAKLLIQYGIKKKLRE